jgi:hypothetical protein
MEGPSWWERGGSEPPAQGRGRRITRAPQPPAAILSLITESIGPWRRRAPRFSRFHRGQEHMGMVDQRGQRRQVVCDGQRQAQGTAQDERGHSGEQRSIRLLTDDGGGRAAIRSGPATGRPGPGSAVDADPAPVSGTVAVSEPATGPATEWGPDDRPRRLRCDETHAAEAAKPNGACGRGPGPLRARIALRHSRDTAG